MAVNLTPRIWRCDTFHAQSYTETWQAKGGFKNQSLNNTQYLLKFIYHLRERKPIYNLLNCSTSSTFLLQFYKPYSKWQTEIDSHKKIRFGYQLLFSLLNSSLQSTYIQVSHIICKLVIERGLIHKHSDNWQSAETLWLTINSAVVVTTKTWFVNRDKTDQVYRSYSRQTLKICINFIRFKCIHEVKIKLALDFILSHTWYSDYVTT